MKEQDKQLLFKDLCTRLPYRTKCYCEWSKEASNGTSGCVQTLSTFLIDELEIMGKPEYDCQISDIKPYLRPMSSMTEEERRFLLKFGTVGMDENDKVFDVYPFGMERIMSVIDFLNAHHFDYRGLIEKGLAIEASEKMYEKQIG